MNLPLNDSDYVNRLLARSRCGDPQREADARLELEQWVAVSDDNRRCYEAQRQTVIALDASLDSLRQRYPRHLAPASAAQAPALATRNSRRGWAWPTWSSALVLLLGVGLTLWWVNPVLSQGEYVTGLGEHREVYLSDGSRVQLNTNTHLDFVRRLRSREVQLVQGEALFEVTHQANIPFEVTSLDTRVRVLGTVFNVRQWQEGNQVTVLEGRVQVTPDHEADSLQITRGQQLRTRHGLFVDGIRDVDATQAVSWRDGRLVFSGETLAEAVAELQRYRNGRIRIHDSKLGALRISGSFSLAKPDELLHLLPELFALNLVINPDQSVDIRAR